MPMVMLTDNYYMSYALRVLWHESSKRDDICIIDTGSFSRLIDIRKVLSEIGVNNDYRIILIGGEDICAQLLTPLGVIPTKSTTDTFRAALAEGGSSYESLLRQIANCRALWELNFTDLSIATDLKKGISITDLSAQKKISLKLLYCRVSRAAKKMNLKSSKDFIRFLATEFTED